MRTTVDLPSNTILGSFSHVLVYTVSDLAEQTTPVATLIEDAGLVVSEARTKIRDDTKDDEIRERCLIYICVRYSYT